MLESLQKCALDFGLDFLVDLVLDFILDFRLDFIASLKLDFVLKEQDSSVQNGRFCAGKFFVQKFFDSCATCIA